MTFWLNLKGTNNMNKLKEIRTKNGLTQLQLAQKSGLSIQNIKKLENKDTNLTNCKYETLEKLAKCLKVSIEKLIN